MNNKLLENYIENIVKESLKAAFVDPFLDIAKTAAYGIEDMSARTKSLLGTVFKGLPTLFIPFLEADYESINKQEAEDLKRIKEKYSDVLERNDEAFYGTDLMPMAFLLDPQLTLGARFAAKVPERVLRVIEILTGGNEKVTNLRKSVTVPLGKWHSHNDVSANPHAATAGQGGIGGDYSIGNGSLDYGSMNEAVPAPQGTRGAQPPMPADPKAMLAQQVQNLLKDPQIISQIENSPIVQNMRNDAINVYIKHVAKFMSAKTLEELIKSNGQALNQLGSNVEVQLKKAKPEEVETLKQTLLGQLKIQYKTFYVNKLNQMASSKPSLKLFTDKAIAKIQAMK